jgi:hypothetical protein
MDWGMAPLPGRSSSLQDWWNLTLKEAPKDCKQRLASILIYSAWNLWKEMNRRVFDHVSALPGRVLALIKEELTMRSMACGEAGRVQGVT